MKTFVAHNVLRDYTCGMVVVMAETFEEACEIAKSTFSNTYDHPDDVISNLEEMTSGIEYVYGGG